MKTTIILAITYIFLSIPSSDAQEFLDTDNSWTVEQSRYVFALNQTLRDTFTFFFENEVDINGTKYLELKSDSSDLIDFIYYAKYFREENQKIYIKTANENDPEVLFYDFGLEVGDTMQYLTSEFAVVIEKDIIQLEDGIDRNRLELKWLNNVSNQNSIWIEGIGSLTSPINPKHLLFQDVGIEMLCFSYNDKVISGTPRCLISTNNINLSNQEDVNIFPNPFDNKLILENIKPNSVISVFNSLGKKLVTITNNTKELNTSNWSNGIYFMSIKSEEGKSKAIKVIKTSF